MIVAFDIGGSRIRAASWDDAVLSPLGETGTPTGNKNAFVTAIRDFLPPKAQGVAISIAGVVDPATRMGKVANIPAIDGLALGPALELALGLPVLVLNDADCFALAEATQGAGRGHGTVFGVILGTGVGGGLVIGGKVVTGAGGYAGEWGHGPVIRGKYAFACGCGQVGCIDMIGGARGLERLHQARTGTVLGAEAVVQDAATMALWLDLVAGPLAMVVNVLGADVVPVGGGLSRAAGLVTALDAAVRDRVLHRGAKRLLVPAQCGPDAGLLGAAMAGAAIWG